MLLELVLATSFFAVVLFAVSGTLVSGIKERNESFADYTALTTVRSLTAQIQELANLPQDLAQLHGIGTLFKRFNGYTAAVAELTDGQLSVTCYADEANVPATLGGPQDLNADVDQDDDIATDADGLGMTILPLEITLTYTVGDGTRTLVVPRLITRTN